ncbi:uncharacterized protein LOC116304007 [Actinia tenebrosa]|uniref:Uncharacterized protein LOC116304007 n=1 Tax=Actinia tenebrosa TaxID=6105 RepID=A0A6P8IRK8_ACTTE|nr:uncharacterized protein LOC116304007 [Actinia tenebrosa]XP_031569512.1 uncharacterized protein LOC116304007 [Actinia tenebrosa]
MDDNAHRPPGAVRGNECLNTSYVVSLPGIIKIGEFILLLVAFASLTGFTSSHSDRLYGGRYDFFYFATITSWLIVLVIFLLFASNLNHRLDFNWNIVLMVYSVVTAVLLLLTSALVLDAVLFYRSHREHLKSTQDYVGFCTVEKCANIEAAGAFGILATVLFIADAVFFFIQNRSSRAAPPPGAEQF